MLITAEVMRGNVGRRVNFVKGIGGTEVVEVLGGH